MTLEPRQVESKIRSDVGAAPRRSQNVIDLVEGASHATLNQVQDDVRGALQNAVCHMASFRSASD